VQMDEACASVMTLPGMYIVRASVGGHRRGSRGFRGHSAGDALEDGEEGEVGPRVGGEATGQVWNDKGRWGRDCQVEHKDLLVGEVCADRDEAVGELGQPGEGQRGDLPGADMEGNLQPGGRSVAGVAGECKVRKLRPGKGRRGQGFGA
jgi:hypothetical protein